MKKLYRSKTNKVIAGVCGGIAEYANVDPTIIRVAWAIVSICSVGLGVLAYLACMLILPEGPDAIEG